MRINNRPIAIIAFIMMFLICDHAKSQDSLKVEGEVLVVVQPSLIPLYNEICYDTLDLSTQAQIEFNWLDSIGVEYLEMIGWSQSTELSSYFSVHYDSSILRDTMHARLYSHAMIDTVIDIVSLPDSALGCYEYERASEYMDDAAFGTDRSYWIWNPEQYVDQSMGVLAAWEFTMSDPTVRTLVHGGWYWYLRQQDRNEYYWQEISSQILDGIFWYGPGEGREPITYLNPGAYPGYEYEEDGMNDHSLWVMRIIAGQFNDYEEGTLGIAPNSLLLPIVAATSDDWLKVLDFGIANGARILHVSMMLGHSDEMRDHLKLALENNILPIIAYGNLGRGINLTLPETLNVASNVGSYKSVQSRYAEYPDVNICSTGDYTSHASATASGVAALVASLYPNMTAAELKQKLLDSCDPMADPLWSPDEGTTQLGKGRLNAYQAIAQRKSGDITADETWNGPIYIPSDLTIKPGVTVTINLATLANGVRKTHVRFGSESYTQPVQLIWPKIIVEGNLIVHGEADEKILFSNLHRAIPYEYVYMGQWGGIEVKSGGSLTMNHALIEHCRDGIKSYSENLLIENTEICNTWSTGITIQVYNQTPTVTPIVRNCDIHSGLDKRVGIAVWRGKPTIEDCELHDLDIGIHYYGWNSRGECRENNIYDTKRHGILCVEDSKPLIVDNTICGNDGNGISLFVNRQYPLIVHNTIDDNGRAGLNQIPPVRTGDGIYLFNAAVRMKDNQIGRNTCGVRLESHSTINGGDGVIGLGGTEAQNVFEDNDYSIYANDHSVTNLGFRSNTQQFGHNNDLSVDPASGIQVHAKNSSHIWVQCNTWNPNGRQYFNEIGGGRIFNLPDYQACTPPSYQYPDSEFQLANEMTIIGDFNGARSIYNNLGGSGNEAIVMRTLSGIADLYVSDTSISYPGVIDTLLDDISQYNMNSSMNLRSNIAYTQGVVATSDGNNIKADSVMTFADVYLSDTSQARNNLTSMLYLHLYNNSDIPMAESILNTMQMRFPNDSLVATAQDLYRYYVDLENGIYVNKSSNSESHGADEKTFTPREYELCQNYPNPFNPTTMIRYKIFKPAKIRLFLTDVFGRHIRELKNSFHTTGEYYVTLNAADLPSGVYFYTLQLGHQAKTMKMILIK